MQPEFKIIADHLRSSCFLIADGALPSNEGRGYVLRRIMRRAMRQLHKLGAKQALMHKFVDALIKEMGDAYPELSRARALMIETLKNEEEKFRETLEKGLKILDEEIAKMRVGWSMTGANLDQTREYARENSLKTYQEINSGQKKFSGEIAFKLYDTYGFPLDLTQDILKEKNIEIDLEAFEREMEEQKNRSQASWKGSGEALEDREILELQEKISATKFLGYEFDKNDGKILYLARDGAAIDAINQQDTQIAIILDQTPFYATSGGQKGDDGEISGANFKAEIIETKKIGKLFIHYGKLLSGEVKIGDVVQASINQKTRKSREKNHSATHLMHKALKLILGDSISQKGSNVDANYFTFDFNLNRAMTSDEIKQVEDLVNFYIAQNSASKIEEMSLDKARESGAEALFGEKYEENVRVISMGFDEKSAKPYSIELCGGTHVKSTGEIEFFKIISEKSVASGIRRIEAMTGDGAKEFVLDELRELHRKFAGNCKVLGGDKSIDRQGGALSLAGFDYKKISDEILDLQEKISAQELEIKALNKKLQEDRKRDLLKNLDQIVGEKINGTEFISHIFEDMEAKDLRDVATNLKAKNKSALLLLFAKNDGKISVIVALGDELRDAGTLDSSVLIKEISPIIGGKGGGGKKDFAMSGGDDENGVEKAVAAVKGKL